MRILITGGGTGGHLVPAIALGESLKNLRPDTELLFVGTTVGLDDQMLSKSGFRYKLLTVRGFRGHNLLARMRASMEFFSSVGQARRILKDFKPQLVVGVGGFASASASVAAIIAGIPLVLMEQNTRPGLANRLLWRFARRIFVAFEESAEFFERGKVEVAGNPIRFKAEQVTCSQPVDNSIRILVLGGSSGAHRLNIAVVEAFKNLRKTVINLEVVHQTGPLDEEVVRSGYVGGGVEATVTPFIDEMARAYAQADLIIARSGAMTVSEVAIAGKPAIFVPYPFHRDLQQLHNARVFEKLGGAMIVNDDSMLAENLASKVAELIGDRSRLVAMGERMRAAAKPDAGRKIASACFEIAEMKNAA